MWVKVKQKQTKIKSYSLKTSEMGSSLARSTTKLGNELFKNQMSCSCVALCQHWIYSIHFFCFRCRRMESITTMTGALELSSLGGSLNICPQLRVSQWHPDILPHVWHPPLWWAGSTGQWSIKFPGKLLSITSTWEWSYVSFPSISCISFSLVFYIDRRHPPLLVSWADAR